MIDRILADLVVIAHLVFIVFGLLGGLLALWRPWAMLAHLPAASWIVLLEFRGWSCPLTGLENSLRQQAGRQGYSGGFVEHYLVPLIYPAGLTSNLQLILGILALSINLMIYAWVWYRWRNRKKPGI